MGTLDEVIRASIDIGTNTVLLLVADWNGHKLKILRDEARITRLGEGLHQTAEFLSAAGDRALKVLREYGEIATSLGAKEIVAAGTAAFRKAKNANTFIDRVRCETGISIEIISGEEEARLSYLSVERDFGGSNENLIALDIGGGSTEIMGPRLTARRSPLAVKSFPLGAVVLSEKHLTDDPPDNEQVRHLEDEIMHVLTSYKPTASCEPRASLVALAGTVTTLSAIKQKLVVWDGAKIQGSLLTLEEIDSMISLFRETTHQEKAMIPGMVRGREDTILAGALILWAVMKTLDVSTVTVSDRGLRFGLWYDRFVA